MDANLTHVVWHAALLGFIWLPFAIGAVLFEHARDPIARELKNAVLHPLRALHDYRVAHAH